jgi:hypothetical protein
MSAANTLPRFNIEQLAARFRNEMVPLGARFCYFCAAVSLSEDDLREYLEEPVAALPPIIAASLPRVQILLVPYLENESNGRKSSGNALISTERPEGARAMDSAALRSGDEAVLAFALKDQEVADYHYTFYRAIAELVAGAGGAALPADYVQCLREELSAGSHGEVDEESWRLKQNLARRGGKARGESRLFREYARQSFVDTLTLYLHGICCDIDVEPGPRQIASRLLRRRLNALRALYPPPQGYTVFPEEA